ncbi:MAG: copper transporter [Chitinophagaceae bacterium BSSC1]|nr:MAG: copper transporter [Chitinophagaceae bacterium BSSC1]
MPQDSVFSDHPGDCPKCGMALVKIQVESATAEVNLDDLLKPTNQFVVSNIEVTTYQMSNQELLLESLGSIAYDTRYEGSIAARISGRIEKLYVKYRYQHVEKGEKIMEIYSPEIMTAEQNLLFLLRNDPSNTSFIAAAKNKLLLLGLDERALQELISTQNPKATIAVYSNYSGHIHEAGNGSEMKKEPGTMKDISQLTEELVLKEGMYVQKERTVFQVLNPDRAWAILNLYSDQVALVKKGNLVEIFPETALEKHFQARIDFVEPFFRKDSKTQTVRVFFNNQSLKIPIGSQVKAKIHVASGKVNWLPKDAILSLGMDKMVFKKEVAGFRAWKVQTGMQHGNLIQVTTGLKETDSIATNAQYLMDSESFINTKQ